METSINRDTWRNLFIIVITTAFIFVFFEWLFMITKPSFMSLLGFPQKLEILLFSSLVLYALIALPLAPFALITQTPVLRKYASLLASIGALFPAFIMAALCLLLLDNFTYTLIKFDISSSNGLVRAAYGIGFSTAWAAWWIYLARKSGALRWDFLSRGLQRMIIPGLLLAIFLPYPMAALQVYRYQQRGSEISEAPVNQPNILIITSDGLSASNMSLYGYARDTSPNLRKLAQSSLVAENAFTNSATTTGSLISIYTGKSPARTRVLYPPDILQGADAYQHLPGILKSHGYYTAQLSVPYYADAYKLNILDGFDYVNGRKANQISNPSRLNRYIPIHYANFIDELYERVVSRLKHIFFIARMENPYKRVNSPEKKLEDLKKMRTALQMLKDSDEPIFVHMHLMGTHGGIYTPETQVFSAGQDMTKQEPWGTDFYDDSILQFDQMVGMIVEELAQSDLLERTVVVIGSDHGKRWESLQRIPLLIRFPRQKHAGRITTNVQNLDIAPTILDYLGLETPGWMEGASLLNADMTHRPIFAASYTRDEIETSQGDQNEQNEALGPPPFYQFGALSIIDCHKWRRLLLTEQTWESGEVLGHTAPCTEDEILTDEQIRQLMIDYLQENGFDANSIK